MSAWGFVIDHAPGLEGEQVDHAGRCWARGYDGLGRAFPSQYTFRMKLDVACLLQSTQG